MIVRPRENGGHTLDPLSWWTTWWIKYSIFSLFVDVVVKVMYCVHLSFIHEKSIYCSVSREWERKMSSFSTSSANFPSLHCATNGKQKRCFVYGKGKTQDCDWPISGHVTATRMPLFNCFLFETSTILWKSETEKFVSFLSGLRCVRVSQKLDPNSSYRWCNFS